MSAGEWIKGLLSIEPMATHRAALYRHGLSAAIVVLTARTAIDTLPGVWGDAAAATRLVAAGCLVLVCADFLLRLLAAGLCARPLVGVAAYLFSFYGLFDVAAALPLLLADLFDWSQDWRTVFGLICFLKLARYSPALETLGAVVLAEFRPLVSAMFIMALLVLGTSTLLYFVERDLNPGMISIPHAMWWSVVTLATLGYGDVVPVSALGKVLGGVVGILGLGMFALPASILASGFTEEMRRQNFVTTWHLVAKVPFFAHLQASQIAQLASLLKVQRVMRGETLMRAGDDGDCMYFLVSGQVEVSGHHGSFVLKAGDFFGEIALLERRPRTASVRALTRCQVLILDARDFHQFTANSPEILQTIRETAQSRLSASQSGEQG